MPDPSQLPYLLFLLEDESEQVQLSVIRQLASFGSDLMHCLKNMPEPPDDARRLLIKFLVEDFRRGLLPSQIAMEEDEAQGRRRFKSGQIVRHRRYGYRGVVVAFDSACRAGDDWYKSNRTRPDREQPWYYVLVHHSHQVTYVAQPNLELDTLDEEVIHPLLKHFFLAYHNGFYVRNGRPWPRPDESDG